MIPLPGVRDKGCPLLGTARPGGLHPVVARKEAVVGRLLHCVS